MKSFFIFSGILLAIFYLSYNLLFFFFQKQIIFPLDGKSLYSERKVYPETERLWIDTDAGKTDILLAYPIHFDPSIRYPLLMISHGNAEVIDDWIDRIDELRAAGIIVALVEYPGYGFAEGKASANSTINAFVAAYDSIITKRFIDKDQIVFLGFSLGGGIVCETSLRRPANALILISTFSSIRRMAVEHGILPFLVRESFNNSLALSKFNGPVLIVHGKQDNIIPVRHSRLLANANSKTEIYLLEGGHNDLIRNWDIFFRETVLSFLRKNLKLDRN